MKAGRLLPAVAIATSLLVSACASKSTQPQEIEAVRDYIVANELVEVEQIRTSRNMSYTYLNDRFVLWPSRRGDYLVELNRDCQELRSQEWTPHMVDRRDSSNVLRARFDTIRGCRINTIYEINKDQKAELRNLGDAPGDELFLPESSDDDSGA